MVNLEEYNDLTHAVIGGAMRVHSTLGNGFQEVIYQRALAIELRKAEILFNRETEMSIYYNDEHIGTRRVDFLIDKRLLVELKATTKVEDAHYAQILNYSVATTKRSLSIGLSTPVDDVRCARQCYK